MIAISVHWCFTCARYICQATTSLHSQPTSIDIVHRDDMVSGIQQVCDDHGRCRATGKQQSCTRNNDHRLTHLTTTEFKLPTSLAILFLTGCNVQLTAERCYLTSRYTAQF